jgi:hypothetical protein
MAAAMSSSCFYNVLENDGLRKIPFRSFRNQKLFFNDTKIDWAEMRDFLCASRFLNRTGKKVQSVRVNRVSIWMKRREESLTTASCFAQHFYRGEGN